MMKIIIDTDIGDDIDDAIAVSMALNHDNIDILGITTVFTRPDLRAKLTAEMLKRYNQSNISVVCGESKPLSGIWDMNSGPNQYYNYMSENEYVTGLTASDYMIQTAEKYPGEITIVAIGVLTNIAEAIQKSSDFVKNIKGIILMGGTYREHYCEWNIRWDADAAKIVFDSGADIVMIGLDVTMRCTIETDELLNLLLGKNTQKSQFLSQMVRSWMKESLGRPVILHDVLAIAHILDGNILTTEKKNVAIETKGEYTKGMTFCYNSPFGEVCDRKPNVHVCTDIDLQRFNKLFIKYV